MRVNSSQNSQLSFGASFYDKFFEKLPDATLKNPKKFSKLGHAIASPHWNRLILGAATITTQPLYDYFNPRVNKDTAETSAIRTFSKAAVCTTVGFTVRGLVYKLTEKYAHATKEEGSTLLTPKEILEETNTIKRSNKLKLHKNTFSTIAALTVMLFTNFLIDAPLTVRLSNKLIELSNKRKVSKQNESFNS